MIKLILAMLIVAPLYADVYGPAAVASNDHDGFQDANNEWKTNNSGDNRDYVSSTAFGNNGEWVGFGFDLSGIPAGATINSAYVRVYVSFVNVDMTFRLAIEDANLGNTPWGASHLPKSASFSHTSADYSGFSTSTFYLGSGDTHATDIASWLQAKIDADGSLDWINFVLEARTATSNRYLGVNDFGAGSNIISITIDYDAPAPEANTGPRRRRITNQ